MGKNGAVFNPEKFKFAQKETKFAGFTITKSEIKPQEKFINAIRDFSIPKSITGSKTDYLFNGLIQFNNFFCNCFVWKIL